MANLEIRAKNRDVSKDNHKRFYTARDMAIIKKDAAIRNSRIKRGEIKRNGNEYIAECGCGGEGCFIHSGYDSKPREDNE